MDSVKLEYNFYPAESFDDWRASAKEIDSVTFTNSSGEFNIKFSTATVTFDSLIITPYIEGYSENKLTTTAKDWQSGVKFFNSEFGYDFGDIKLNKRNN